MTYRHDLSREESQGTRTDDSELAIDGGRPVRQASFAPWPTFAVDEIDAALGPLRSGQVNYWTGEEGRAFEQEFAAYCGAKYAVAVSNGSVALELALHALGIGAGDEVITTSRTFIASASSVVMRGANPVFADVDLDSQNITAGSIARKLTPRTKAVIVVHLAGWPCDMGPIVNLARERGIKVIEDCAQSLGAAYQGRRTGSLGDVAAFSFCQDKILTTGGEGGMLVTDDEAVWRTAWAFKDHGKSWDAVYEREHAPGFRWLHESFGTNWRLTEIQAAIGRAQLSKVESWIDRRRRFAGLLDEAFSKIPGLRVTRPPEGFHHSYYKYYTFVRPELLGTGWDRDRVMEAVTAEGIPCYSGSCSEIYLERAFVNSGMFDGERLRNARQLGDTSLMFLVHPTLTDEDMRDTTAAVGKVMAVATR